MNSCTNEAVKRTGIDNRYQVTGTHDTSAVRDPKQQTMDTSHAVTVIRPPGHIRVILGTRGCRNESSYGVLVLRTKLCLQATTTTCTAISAKIYPSIKSERVFDSIIPKKPQPGAEANTTTGIEPGTLGAPDQHNIEEDTFRLQRELYEDATPARMSPNGQQYLMQARQSIRMW
ncbi:uncharacterized protein [Anabrus simplex]|uniref:uncharacterized protein n=1 Tax=Anabrus simplex TaxID=316456 RepID=UPI0035A36CCB